MKYPLVRVDAPRAGWSLADFSAAAGLHPQLVRRFVTLGLLMPHRDGPGDMVFDAVHLARVARIQRLRAGLGLNYAALGVGRDLLARIKELKAALRARPDGRRSPHR